MKIKKVEVQAFKSYLNKSNGTFDFTMPDGTVANIVCIYAPNGFGKTSFYDAVDYGITRNITRYIRNQSTRVFNSKIADAIGKYSREHETPQSQYVLRTRGAPDDIDTTISIETTVQRFYEKIDKPRKNNKDYQFDDSNTPEDRLFFREVMLSQEAIDSFLREDKAELRYSQFMDFQPSKVREMESERQVITRLVSDLSKKEKLLSNEINEIEEEITSFEISDATIEKSMSMYESIKQNGYDVPEVSKEFDELEKNEKKLLVSLERTKIIKHLEKLESDAKIISDNRTTLSHSLEKIIEEQRVNKQVDNSNNKISQLNSYSELNQGLLKLDLECSNHIESISNLSSKLSDLEKFHTVIVKHEENKKLKSKLEESLKNIHDNKNKLTTSKELLNKQLTSNRESLQNLNNSLNSIDNTFVNIEENNQLLNAYNLRKGGIKKSIDENLKQYEIVDNTIKKIESIDFESDSWIYQPSFSYDEIDIDTSKLEEISRFKNEKGIEITTIESLLSRFKYRDHQLSRLIDSSLDFLNKSENKDIENCPLCSQFHHSHDNLCKVITDNSLLDSRQKDLQSKKSKLATEVNELSAIYNDARQKVRLFFESKLTDERNKLIYLKNEKSELNLALNSLNESILSSEKTLEKLHKETKGLDKNSLISLYKEDQKNRESAQSIIIKKINTLELKLTNLTNDIENIRSQTSNTNKNNEDFDFYVSYMDFLNSSSIDITGVASNDAITKIESNLKSRLVNLKGELSKSLSKKESIVDEISKINRLIVDLTVESLPTITVSERQSLTMLITQATQLKSENRGFNDFCLIHELDDYLKEGNFSELRNAIDKRYINIVYKIEKTKAEISEIGRFNILIDELYSSFAKTKLKKTLSELSLRLTKIFNIKNELENDLVYITDSLKELVDGYFYKELINKVYEKIDPHPEFKEIKFECSFPENSSPQLNVFVQKEESCDFISPNLSFSSAQISVLSLSIFLARAINNKGFNGQPCECILIDDPIQSMDSINILSTIDLLRNVSLNLDRQIVISTHDENFFELMKVKLPVDKSKFFSLVSYGRVEQSISS